MSSADRVENHEGISENPSTHSTLPSIRTQIFIEVPFFLAGALAGAEIGNLSSQLLQGVPFKELAHSWTNYEQVNSLHNFNSMILGSLVGAGISREIVTRFTRRRVNLSLDS